MILLDTNLLLYAHDQDSGRHGVASAWLENALSGPETVGIPWTVLIAFLRIATSRHILRQPLSMQEAAAAVTSWLERPNVETVGAGDRHWEILGSLLGSAQVRGDLVNDAHLAALALEHGATVCTHDRDFSRFPGLRILDPFAG